MNRWTRLASLSLFRSPIEGTIPTELVSLTSLRSVAIDKTAHTGTIPPQLFTTTGSIPRDILLDCPLLCGSIPTQVGLAHSLTFLYVYFFFFSRECQLDCSSTDQLQRRTLSGRGLHGDLPSQLWQLTSLTSLILSDAEFQGTLPSDIALLTALRSFAIRRTNIGGTIPTQLGKLSQLRFLSLMFSNFNGTTPAAILGMSSLQHLFLNNNNLTGSIVAADVSPSITSCIVQGYADVADSNCLSSPCAAPCCRIENAACAPRNDDCAYPQLLADVGVTKFSTLNATARTCVGCTSACVIRRDVWFEWHATCTGTASVEICDVDNVALLIYDNEACPPRIGNTGSDSECNQAPKCANGKGARLQHSVTIGQVLWIRVGSLVATAGFEATIAVSCQGNAAPNATGQCSWWIPPSVATSVVATTSTTAIIAPTTTTPIPATIAPTSSSTATTGTTTTTTITTTTTTTTTTTPTTTIPPTTTPSTLAIGATLTTTRTAGGATLASIATTGSVELSADSSVVAESTQSMPSTTTSALSSLAATSSFTLASVESSTPVQSVATLVSTGDGAQQSSAEETLSPAVLNGIIGGGVAVVAVLCVALVVTALMVRRAARANKRSNQMAVSMQEQRKSSAPAYTGDYDRFPLPAEVSDEHGTHYQSLAPHETN
jgi:hypothetical protein